MDLSLQEQRAWLDGQKSFTAIELFGFGELRGTARPGPGPTFRAAQNSVS